MSLDTRLLSYHYEWKLLLILYFLLQQYRVTFISHTTGKDTLYCESGQSCLLHALLTQFLLWLTGISWGDAYLNHCWCLMCNYNIS